MATVRPEQDPGQYEDDSADNADGLVLAVEIGLAPSRMAPAISCIRALPASAFITD